MRKLLSLLLALALVLSLGVTGFASGDPSGEASGEASSAVEDTGPKAAFVFGDEGENTENEQTDGFELEFYNGGGLDETGLRGFRFTSDSPDAALFYAEPRENPVSFTIGGDAANYVLDEFPGSADALFFLRAMGVESFDSVIELGDEENADSCRPVISAKGLTELNIENVALVAAGASRSAFYSDVSGGTTVAGPGSVGGQQGQETPVVVVSNSLLETTGGEGTEGEISFGNAGGRARGIQPQGKSIIYLYNSAIVSHTWGAWSTDSARQSLDLVAWRSLGLSQGGYGAYADTSCRLFLYGSTVIGSSDGIVASNDGEIYAVSSDNETNTTDLRAFMGRTNAPRDLCWTDHPVEGDMTTSVIMGGQAAVQFHMPDMGHSGAGNRRIAALYMQGGALVTDQELLQNGVDGLAAYNRHYAGACIVTKSTQANIRLDGTAMSSWNGELIHTMINSDSNVNNIADGDEAAGSDITFSNMDVTGDIVHDDYQRELRLVLDGTTLTGAIRSNTCEDWNAVCEAEFDGAYILNPDGYETRWGVVVDLTGGAVWNVTENSVVTDLIINDGCTVNGVISENPDGTLTVSPLA